MSHLNSLFAICDFLLRRVAAEGLSLEPCLGYESL
jgi:hypothetical protein